MATVRIDRDRLLRDALARSSKGVWAAGEQFKGDVRIVLSGQRHGRLYRVPGTGRDYTASAPGEAPAVRTGNLKARVASRLNDGQDDAVSVDVGVNIDAPPYPRWLEYGTSKMAPRPYMRNTLQTNWNAYLDRFCRVTGFKRSS